jgi:hypothetical protein
VGPRTGPEAIEEKNLISLPEIEPCTVQIVAIPTDLSRHKPASFCTRKIRAKVLKWTSLKKRLNKVT